MRYNAKNITAATFDEIDSIMSEVLRRAPILTDLVPYIEAFINDLGCPTNMRVLSVGCKHDQLYDHLLKNNEVGIFSYIGIDGDKDLAIYAAKNPGLYDVTFCNTPAMKIRYFHKTIDDLSILTGEAVYIILPTFVEPGPQNALDSIGMNIGMEFTEVLGSLGYTLWKGEHR